MSDKATTQPQPERAIATEDGGQGPQIPPQRSQPAEVPPQRISKAKRTASRTEAAMIKIAEGGDLAAIATEMNIPVSTLSLRIALYGLRAARVCALKGVSRKVLHGTIAHCDHGPNPTKSLFVPVALEKAELSEEERWVEE